MLGVEEPFFDALTHPDAELTPAVVANRRLLLEEINAGRSELTAKPLELVIGVASHCNISCGFCSGPMGSYGELTERRLAEVMAQLPTLMNLSVVGPGEPLMSKLFPKLLEHINDTGYPSLHVSMTTNGTLMTPSWLARHRNVRLGHIRISLNAGSAATHERMTGKRFFDRLMENIDTLAERKRQSDARFELTLSCVLSEYVLGDLMNFAEIVDRANANVVVEPMYGNALGLSPYVKADRLRALRDECRAVSDAFAVRNPKVARAFRAMEQFAQGRLQRRHLAVLPQH
jgi:MoaA/NifB/PqqE/SkfB family radical SAM enzyme